MTATARALETGWCTFRVDGGLYGVELPRVHEVLRPQPLTRVPLAPPAVAGLLNLRGRIVPALELRTLFGRAPREGAAGGFVVVRRPDGLVALVVDDVGDVLRHGTAATPAGPDSASQDPIASATVALPGHLLVVLDLDRVLALAFERAASEPAARARIPARRNPGAQS